MRFSIVVPVYNSAAFLSAAVASVQGQTCPDWELLLIDDGSTDQSGEMIRAFAAQDARILGIYQENRGQFWARQAGIDRAEGDYLLFLDSDDILVPEALSVLQSALAEKEWDMLLFTGALVTESGAVTGQFGAIGAEREIVSPRRLQKALLFSNELNSLCIKAIRRGLFDSDPTDYAPFGGKGFGEDKARLLYPASQAKEILFLPDCLYRYTRREGSVSHTYTLGEVPTLLAPEVFRLLDRYAAHWGLTDRESQQQFTAYRLRAFLSVYFGVRKTCRAKGEMGAFRRVRWRDEPEHPSLRGLFCPKLTARERLKLLVAAMHL